MFDLLENDSELIARKALDVMVELYRRQVWTDARSVNVIASACLSRVAPLGEPKAQHARVSVGGVRFFLGIETRLEEDQEKEREVVDEAVDSHSHSHKTRARQRDTERQVAARRRKLRRANQTASNPRFPAIALVYDPQGFAEKLLSRLRTVGQRREREIQTKEQFSVRLLLMDLISRFIGYHKLCVFAFYPFVQSYLTAHQQHVTRILVFLTQACHDFVPPEELFPLLRVIADNFVSDHSSPEAAALGINTISEIFSRVPLLFEADELQPLIRELVAMKSHKDKGVAVAARGFLGVEPRGGAHWQKARKIYPACLSKKDRGRDAVRTLRPLAFGEDHVRVSVEGMEALGRMLEKGEVDEAELESLEAWKEEGKKERNAEGELVTRRKRKPVRISREALELAAGPRHEKRAQGEKEEGEEKEKEEKKEEEKNEEEDEALLEGEEDSEVIVSEEEEGEDEEEEEENEEEEEESEGEDEELEEEESEENEEEEEEEEEDDEADSKMNEEEMSENENENQNDKADHSPAEDAASMEEEEEEPSSEDSDSLSPEKAEEVRQRRIALARDFMSTHILPPKLFRILQGDRNDDDDDSSSDDSEEEQNADVANDIVMQNSPCHE